MVAGNFPHFPRPKIQPGGEEHLRQPSKVQTPDIEQVPNKYIALALVHLRNQIAKLVNMIDDRSKPVDEYNVQSLAPESDAVGSTLLLQPQYEVSEIIEGVLVTGPAGGTGTIQLGDRVWPFVIPASQILYIGGPLGVCLGRSDPRQLTVIGTAGEYTLELMGHADARGNLI